MKTLIDEETIKKRVTEIAKLISAEFNGQWKVSELIGINFNLGYKTKG